MAPSGTFAWQRGQGCVRTAAARGASVASHDCRRTWLHTNSAVSARKPRVVASISMSAYQNQVAPMATTTATCTVTAMSAVIANGRCATCQ